MRKILAILVLICGLGTISSCQKENMDIEVTGVSIDKSLVLGIGQVRQLTATILPENATENVDLVWSSSNSEVASVDASGKVTALKEGEAIISVQVKNKSIKDDCAVTVQAEVDNDIVFEDEKLAALVLAFDTNNDGKLQESEAKQVTQLNISGNEIKSLKGIEYFTALEILDCSLNSIKELDVTKNVALKELYCRNNVIETLDLTTLENLQVLNCSSNRLSSIDVSKNTKLVKLRCGMNSGSGYENLGITSVDVSNNPDLEILDVYYLNLSSLDVTNNPKLKILDMSYCCHVMWNLKPVEELDLSNNPDLEELRCVSSNYPDFGLNSLDVTNNPKLRVLSTYGNPKIAKLDLSKNTELTSLNCSHNSLSELDLTNCPKLDTLSCEYNNIVKLDLTKSVALTYVNCANNQIDGLDLSNTQLGYLLAQDNQIATINMGDKTFDTRFPSNAAGDIAGQPYLYMKLNNNKISSIDLSKQTYLHWLEIDNNLLTELNVNGCTKLRGLHCADNNLIELKLEQLTELWELDCSGNNLSGILDLSALANAGVNGLSRLAAQNNNLTAIKVYQGFNPDATYFLGGTGTLPCYTKDAQTDWLF